MKYWLVACVLLSGCNGVNRLTGGETPSRNSGYDTTPVYPDVSTPEPYATLVGQHDWPDGTFTRLFLVHWKGNTLDNKSILETDLISLNIPEK